MKKHHTHLMVVLFSIISLSANAQMISKEQLLSAWDNMTNMVIGSAEAMPDSLYDFVPFDGARNFADQMNHTAMANFTFMGSSLGLEKKSEPLKSQNKTAVIADLKSSFKYVRKGIENLGNNEMADRVEKRNGTVTTKMAQFLRATDHLQREHGKSIMYLRLNGIAPARSGGFY